MNFCLRVQNVKMLTFLLWSTRKSFLLHYFVWKIRDSDQCGKDVSGALRNDAVKIFTVADVSGDLSMPLFRIT